MNLQPVSNRKEIVNSREKKDRGFGQVLNFLEKHEDRYRNRDEIIKNLQKLLENIR